jgi:hypothetical protein
VEIPKGYAVHLGAALSIAVGVLGLGLIVHLGLQAGAMPAASGLLGR